MPSILYLKTRYEGRSVFPLACSVDLQSARTISKAGPNPQRYKHRSILVYYLAKSQCSDPTVLPNACCCFAVYEFCLAL